MQKVSASKNFENNITYRVSFSDSFAEQKIIESLKNNRFVILKDHSVHTELLQSVYELWLKFFDNQEKIKLLRSDIIDEG